MSDHGDFYDANGENDSDDESFQSACSALSPTLAASMMSASTSPLFRSAYSTLEATTCTALHGTKSEHDDNDTEIDSSANVGVAKYSDEKVSPGKLPAPARSEDDTIKLSSDIAKVNIRTALHTEEGSKVPDAVHSTSTEEITSAQTQTKGSELQSQSEAEIKTQSHPEPVLDPSMKPSPLVPMASKQKAPTQNAKRVDERVCGDTGSWRLITDRTELSRPRVNFVSFNQDNSCVSAATERGFKIRTVLPPPGRMENRGHQCNISSGVAVCQMLFGTSLVAFVKAATPRMLSLTNAWTGETFRDLHFVASVKRVDMNRKVMCVLTTDGRLHVFNLKTLRVIKSICVSHASDPARLIEGINGSSAGAFYALSNVEKECFLVCRCRQHMGQVRVYRIDESGGDNLRVAALGSFDAHSHSIARIAIGGRKGRQKLATASEKGTVIRIFRLGSQFEKQDVLLRGSKPSKICSISFNCNATRILASSFTSGTVHAFKLDGKCGNDGVETRADSTPRKKSRNMKLLSSILPEVVSDQTDGLRSYAKIRFNTASMGATDHLIVAFLTPSSSDMTALDDVLLLTSEGILIKYIINEKGKATQVNSEDILLEDSIK